MPGQDDVVRGCFNRLESAGLTAAIEIILADLGGLRVWVPTRKALLMEGRNQRIKNRFTGFNVTELAIEYGLTDRQIRRIIKK